MTGITRVFALLGAHLDGPDTLRASALSRDAGLAPTHPKVCGPLGWPTPHVCHQSPARFLCWRIAACYRMASRVLRRIGKELAVGRSASGGAVAGRSPCLRLQEYKFCLFLQAEIGGITRKTRNPMNAGNKKAASAGGYSGRLEVDGVRGSRGTRRRPHDSPRMSTRRSCSGADGCPWCG